MLERRKRPTHLDIIAIGASAGGVLALKIIFDRLSPEFATPVIVVQHLPRTARYDTSLIYGGRRSDLRIFEVEDKMPIERGKIYMATPNYHVMVEKSGVFSLSQDEPERHSRPSIDVLFESVAYSFGPTSAGVLLTGANDDGANGLRKIYEHRGWTIVQEPSEAEYDIMPQSALKIMTPDRVLKVEQIADELNSLSKIRPELLL